MTKEERSAALLAACGEDVSPRVVAEKIINNPDDHTVLELWMALAYTKAMLIIDGNALIEKLGNPNLKKDLGGNVLYGQGEL